MKRYFILILFLFSILIIAQDDIIDFMPVEGVSIINQRDYVPNIIKLFNNAQKTINGVVYQTRYYEKYPDGVNRQMYKALFEAVKRGVKVILIVDQSSWNPSSSISNEKFAEFMRENGVEVYFEPPDKTTHSKVIVVDSLYTVIGSTNWSFYALEKNDESAVIVKSEMLAKHYINFFYRLLEFSSKELTILR